ncbi:MAG: glutamate--tRNA ligase [Bdellovibrio sp. CG11_big_fil_rev_8_21_14_0_20_39_38]|nr:MAG: glutamate--tRNA ligase [Bdellovibrio sp. CG22_combo_CG10-13_8_21_14_all_39_27]PIR33866.1 MAG: glutamate--tRNA ligase [Bdellovibrio sp. CG11_big_fil_rev_8_21_14_0_20_39_38]
MTVRVRFAPSPTGYLHIGGARTALYNYLFAKKNGGVFLLRIEDTDQERSKKEYEIEMMKDLKWLGIDWTEGPDCGGEYGPYRQSERMNLYKEKAWELVSEGKAYPCFLTEAELEELSQKAIAENKAPHAYHTKFRDFPLYEAKKRVDAGEDYVIRFKTQQKVYHLKDHVRGDVDFGEDMVGDFVLLRSNGMPVYNYCCAIDDWMMKITHVIRAEEHLPNTLRQLMLYEAFGVTPPQYAHCSLLVGEDRQKLSKRHGATSVKQYIEMKYLPEALNNYLCLLGWSHPDEKDIFNKEDIVDVFTMDRFNKAPALYDVQKLNFFNGQHLRKLPIAELVGLASDCLPSHHPFQNQTAEWKNQAMEIFKEKIQLITELEAVLEIIFRTEVMTSDEYQEIWSWETTGQMASYLKEQVMALTAPATAEQFQAWGDHIKTELKIKGKPLFKGMRAVLTLEAEGPDLKIVIPLTPVAVLKERMTKF